MNRLAAVAGAGSVLDAGCGSARLTVALADAGAADVVGIDTSADRLAQGRVRVSRHPAGAGVHLMEADFDRPLSDGIVIRSWGELKDTDPDADRKMWESSQELLADVPRDTPFEPMPFEEFQSIVMRRPTLDPDGFFVAVDAETGDYVGVSHIWRRLADDDLDGVPVTEPVPGGQRVPDVLLEAVLRAPHRGDAALGVLARALGQAVLRDQDDPSGSGALEGAGEARDPAAQHEKVAFDRHRRRASRA